MLHKYSTWGQALTLAFLLLFLFCSKAAAQIHSEILHYKVINGDTLFVERITPSRCYSRLPRQKGKEWRKYYRLVHNFAKTYPYALASKKIMISVDSTLIADGLKRGKRDKYITQVQKEQIGRAHV